MQLEGKFFLGHSIEVQPHSMLLLWIFIKIRRNPSVTSHETRHFGTIPLCYSQRPHTFCPSIRVITGGQTQSLGARAFALLPVLPARQNAEEDGYGAMHARNHNTFWCAQFQWIVYLSVCLLVKGRRFSTAGGAVLRRGVGLRTGVGTVLSGTLRRKRGANGVFGASE